MVELGAEGVMPRRLITRKISILPYLFFLVFFALFICKLIYFLYSVIDIKWSKKGCLLKQKRDFVVSHRGEIVSLLKGVTRRVRKD